MRVTCGPSGPSEFDLDSKSVEFVVFVVEFGWSLLVWGSTKQLQRWSSVEVPFTHPEEPLCDSEHKYNFDCGSLIRPSYVSPGSSTYRDTRTPVRQRNETRSLSCKQEFISFTFINILYYGITSTFKLVSSICNLNTIL